MSKVDTDQGLGPGSERQRKAVKEEQEKLESGSKQKAAAPVVEKVDKKNAVTEPGAGKVERSSDTVDDLLDGFGTSRPDLPRILPKADTTPPPEPVKKELTPTAPGKRQRTRNVMVVTVLTFAAVVLVGGLLVKLGQSTAQTAPSPSATTPTTTTPLQTANATARPTETIAPITTMAVEALPTVVKTQGAPAPTTTKSMHSATTSTTPAVTATATAPATHPTGTAPPGMNLLPDDPHR